MLGGEAPISVPWRTETIRVDAVVPVYNECDVLALSIKKLHEHLATNVPYSWRIVIADNGSTDGTADVGDRLTDELDRVEVLRIGRKGRGHALRTAWLGSRADIVSYMDADLSTQLDVYCALIAAIADEGHDLAIGRRLGPGATVVGRRLVREVASRGYNTITRLAFGTSVMDAQCGFKAISRAAADRLLPQVVDEEWFFDTELLIRAEQSGCAIKQVPVHWVDDQSSHVKIVHTAMQDLKGIWRLKREGF
jgi:glycosyltransferase involved in cell wall biosynthesis